MTLRNEFETIRCLRIIDKTSFLLIYLIRYSGLKSSKQKFKSTNFGRIQNTKYKIQKNLHSIQNTAEKVRTSGGNVLFVQRLDRLSLDMNRDSDLKVKES